MHVCPKSDTFLTIQYLQGYFCADQATRPIIFTALVVWLLFLFSTLGISASDFFCPNLATIAAFLGLDENVTGVTFLAFGNGSPDLFSTFSAMRTGSGSLAVGELLGAASFIVSVVAGSMCIIKPFKVERYPFIRDVGFFTCAVSLLLAITHDGRIRSWEAISLVMVYLVYVCVVVVGSWWERRRETIRAREALIRQEYTDEETQEPYHDEDASTIDRTSSSPRTNTVSNYPWNSPKTSQCPWLYLLNPTASEPFLRVCQPSEGRRLTPVLRTMKWNSHPGTDVWRSSRHSPSSVPLNLDM